MDSQIIRFHNPVAFKGLTGVVDHQSATIHGVSLITADMEAEGHNLFVDGTTVDQLFQLAKQMGKLPVTMDHEGGINEVNGYIHNFRKDGNHLRGDWCLLKTHEDTPTMLERADRQPGTFGLSVAFKGPPKGVIEGGKPKARAEKLLSADVVKRPACNPAGLFSAKESFTQEELGKLRNMLIELGSVDTAKNGMPKEPSLSELLQAVQALTEQVQAQQQTINQLTEAAQGGEGEGITAEDLLALNSASDEELAQLGLSRDDVDSAVNEALETGILSTGEGEGQGEGQGAEGAAGEGEGFSGYEGGPAAGDFATAGAGAEGGTTAMSAMANRIVALESHIRNTELAAKQEAENIEFSEIENKINILAMQRDEAVAIAHEFAARNEALELAVRTGTRPVAAGVDTGVRLFHAQNGELHQFQVRVKELIASGKCKTEGEAIRFASKENPALHADWIQSPSIRA